MASSDKESLDVCELIALLDQDRALILEKIDQGCWPDMRTDLAALERELGQLIDLVSERLDR